MNLYKIYAIKINERTGSNKCDVPEFVAISVTEAEDKFRKSWKGWKMRYIKI
jgi:hypothetical protein